MFWKLTMPEYMAIMRGFITVEKPKTKGKTRTGLSSEDKNRLRAMLKKDQEKNVSI